jgi:hypothetical protein
VIERDYHPWTGERLALDTARLTVERTFRSAGHAQAELLHHVGVLLAFGEAGTCGAGTAECRDTGSSLELPVNPDAPERDRIPNSEFLIPNSEFRLRFSAAGYGCPARQV